MTAGGHVVAIRSGIVEVCLPAAAIGQGVCIERSDGTHAFGVVTAIRATCVHVAPIAELTGVHAGANARVDSAVLAIPLGLRLLGRALDARGNALDGGPPISGRLRRTEVATTVGERRAITEPFWTGVRALDALLSTGRGARVGLFGAPGCGKSSLLHDVAAHSAADAVVVGLIGERGREAESWIRGRTARMTVVCATSDRPPVERIRAARVAMAQAVSLRERGLHVLLVLDSLARFGSALREVSVAAGESVGRGGYAPSVFGELASYVEAAGSTHRGSITMFASVLSDGDERDPLSEAARSLLDGHVALSSTLAQAGAFPAVDILGSSSRTMRDVVSVRHAEHADAVRATLALLAKSEDARSLGMGPSGESPARQNALERAIETFLRAPGADARPETTLAALAELAEHLGASAQAFPA